jgi:sulfur-oxidizing protein SoxZ
VANSRVKVPTSAKAGDNVEIRVMIMHPMENGYNVDTQGTASPIHIITDFVCIYDGAEVLRVQLQPAGFRTRGWRHPLLIKRMLATITSEI